MIALRRDGKCNEVCMNCAALIDNSEQLCL